MLLLLACAAAVAAGSLGACGNGARALLVLDISKDTGVGDLDRVEVHVAGEVHTWPNDVPVKIGVYLPAGTSGMIRPWVGACLNGVVRGRIESGSVAVRGGQTTTTAVSIQMSSDATGIVCASPSDAGGGAGGGGGGTGGRVGTGGVGGTGVGGGADAGSDLRPDVADGGVDHADADADADGGGSPPDAGRGIADRFWQLPQGLDLGTWPQVGVAASGGRAVMVYTQKDGAIRVARARMYTPSTGWDPAAEYLQDPSSTARRNVQGAPRVVMNDDGVVLAAWYQDVDAGLGYYQIGVNDRGFGAGWHPSSTIMGALSIISARPLLALGSGDLGVFASFDGNGINARTYDGVDGWAKGGFGAIQMPDDGDNILCASAAVNGLGQAFLIWVSQPSPAGQARVFSSRSGPVNPWERQELLASGPLGTLGCPDVAVDDDHNAVAVWTDSRAGAPVLQTSRFRGDAWDAAPTPLDTGGKGAFAPAIRLSGDGRGMLLWEQSTQAPDVAGTAPRDLWSRRYGGVSTSWSGAPVSLGATAPATSERLAVTANGEALAVWIQNDKVTGNRYAYADPSGWTTPKVIDPYWTTPQAHPDVAIDGAGRGLAAWEQALTSGGEPQICLASFE